MRSGSLCSKEWIWQATLRGVRFVVSGITATELASVFRVHMGTGTQARALQQVAMARPGAGMIGCQITAPVLKDAWATEFLLSRIGHTGLVATTYKRKNRSVGRDAVFERAPTAQV